MNVLYFVIFCTFFHMDAVVVLLQITVLNKAKERMQPHQNNQDEEDPDIKKIKMVKNCNCILKCRETRLWEKLSVQWLYRCRVSCVAGCVGGSGKSLSRTISVPLTLRAWGRGTILCSTWWKQRQNTCSSFPSWWIASLGRCAWLPVPRNLPFAMMMLAASSSTGATLFFLFCVTFHTNPVFQLFVIVYNKVCNKLYTRYKILMSHINFWTNMRM